MAEIQRITDWNDKGRNEALILALYDQIDDLIDRIETLEKNR